MLFVVYFMLNLSCIKWLIYIFPFAFHFREDVESKGSYTYEKCYISKEMFLSH